MQPPRGLALGRAVQRMTQVRIRVCVLGVALCWVGAARAQDVHSHADDSVVAAAQGLPDDVDALIVMKDAHAFYRSPAGSALIDLAVRSAGFHATRQSWAALASELGMTSDEAVDALLSRRTLIAARWTNAGGAAWAVEAELSPEMERKIQRALKPAPREVVAGRPVLSVEGGVMEMVLAHGTSGARMVLGPAAEPSLFLEMAAALDQPPAAPLSDTSLFREIVRVGRNADGLVMYRSPQQRDLWFAAVMDQRPLELEAAFLVGVPGMQERGREIAPWSSQTFDRLSTGAYLAVLDLNQLTWGKNAGGIQLLSGLGLPLEMPPDVVALLSDRFALVVRDSTTGPLDVALALETVDTTAMARAGDKWLCAKLRGLATDPKWKQRLDGLEGMPPTAVRTVNLAQFLGSFGGWTAGPHVSWGARIDQANCNVDQHHGWWAVGLGPATVQELGRSVSDQGDQGISLPWLSLGVARPSALVDHLRESGVMVPPVMEPLRRVVEIRWQALEAGRGVVQGYGRVVVKDQMTERDGDQGSSGDAVGAGARGGS